MANVVGLRLNDCRSLNLNMMFKVESNKIKVAYGLIKGIMGYHIHIRPSSNFPIGKNYHSYILELEIIQTQMTQKPVLRAEGECACVAQMALGKIRERRWPSPSHRARHLWVVRTLK
jgi:hypothetical protein